MPEVAQQMARLQEENGTDDTRDPRGTIGQARTGVGSRGAAEMVLDLGESPRGEISKQEKCVEENMAALIRRDTQFAGENFLIFVSHACSGR